MHYCETFKQLIKSKAEQSSHNIQLYNKPPNMTKGLRSGRTKTKLFSLTTKEPFFYQIQPRNLQRPSPSRPSIGTHIHSSLPPSHANMSSSSLPTHQRCNLLKSLTTLSTSQSLSLLQKCGAPASPVSMTPNIHHPSIPKNSNMKDRRPLHYPADSILYNFPKTNPIPISPLTESPPSFLLPTLPTNNSPKGLPFLYKTETPIAQQCPAQILQIPHPNPPLAFTIKNYVPPN